MFGTPCAHPAIGFSTHPTQRTLIGRPAIGGPAAQVQVALARESATPRQRVRQPSTAVRSRPGRTGGAAHSRRRNWQGYVFSPFAPLGATSASSVCSISSCLGRSTKASMLRPLNRRATSRSRAVASASARHATTRALKHDSVQYIARHSSSSIAARTHGAVRASPPARP